MSTELKVKAKSLAAEAAIIRKEEGKALKQARWLSNKQRAADGCYAEYQKLNQHRRWDVRNEARATHLARAYIKGTPYGDVESARKPENEFTFKVYVVPKMSAMISKYGSDKVSNDAVLEWATQPS